MRYFLSIIIFLVSIFTIDAQSKEYQQSAYCFSSLSIDLPFNQKAEIFIDGESFGFLERERIVKNIPNGKRFVSIAESQNQNQNSILFEGFLVFGECQLVYASIAKNGRFSIEEIRYNESFSNEQYEVIYVDGNERNNAYSPSQPNESEPEFYPEPNYPSDRPHPINEGSFNSFLQSIRTMSHDYSKQEIAEMGISANYFLSGQVKEMLHLFSHDHTKLEVAKVAFHKTVDPENYTMLFDLFSHDHSRQELSRYIRSHY